MKNEEEIPRDLTHHVIYFYDLFRLMRAVLLQNLELIYIVEENWSKTTLTMKTKKKS
jgi:hypothetical protein